MSYLTMPFPETFTTAQNGVGSVHIKPTFAIYKEIPAGLSSQIELAVKDFLATSHMPKGIDWEGFYYQTLEAIANSTYLGGGGDFWMGILDKQLLVYTLAFTCKDLDSKLTYHITQTWVRKDYRGKSIVKEWWKALKQRAKDCMCGHLVITSSRDAESYARWLGDGLHVYATLLKMEI